MASTAKIPEHTVQGVPGSLPDPPARPKTNITPTPTPCSNPSNPSTPPTSVSSNEWGKQKNRTPSRFSKWKTKWITDWWGFEIFCCIISTLSLISIIILLESNKSKPLPQWPFKITLNSLISIFATISQMAMMVPVVECISQLKWIWFIRKQKLADFPAFDDASRGPTGCLILLGKLRGLHLVTLGACISICSIAFGAFAQQVVTYPLHPHPSGNASTPLVLNFTGPADNDLTLAGALLASMYNGLSSLSSNGASLSEITPLCSTGNCTWETYPSLGICSTVTDLSSRISKNPCSQATLDGFFQDAGIENPGYPCFNYTLPFQAINSVLDTSGTSQSYGNATLSNVYPLLDNQTWPQFLTLSPATNTSNSSFIGAYLMYQPNIEQSINSSLVAPLAYGLTLDLCIYKYNSTVTDGIPTTSIMSSQPFGMQWSEFEFDNASNDFLIEGPATANISVDGYNFGATQTAFADLTNSMNSLWSENCLILHVANKFPIYCAGFGFGFAFLSGLNQYDPYNVTALITENIAISMTNAFRTGGNTQVLNFTGVAYSPQTYVGANYTWFTFPITLVSLTLVFLLATIFKSQRLGNRVWKSSNIATLQGLHKDLHTSLGGLSSISKMDEKAKEVKVRFDMGDGKAENGMEYRLVELK